MKIFISSQLFYPSKLGGPANAVYWLAKALVRSGHSVKVLTTNTSIDENIPIDIWTDIDGIRVMYCSKSRIPYIKTLKLGFQEIKRSNIVILTSICSKPEIFLALKATRYNIPVIWSPRGEFSAKAINNRLDKKIFFRFIRLILLKRVTFHVTSEAEKKDTIRVLGKNAKTLLIPNYMELPRPIERDKTTLPYFLFLGRIAPIKAIDKLIKGLSLSKKFKTSEYTLRIVGVQEEKFKNYLDSIRLLIKQLNLENHITIEKPLFGQDKFRLLSNASFLTLLSESENFGNVVIEALSQSTPVIASKGTPWALVQDHNAGYWIENTPEIIASTIDKAIELNQDRYNEMRSNALQVAKMYDVFENVYKWTEALSLILK